MGVLRKFWEVENCEFQAPPYSPEEQAVINHFFTTYRTDKEGRFIVHLPKKADTVPLGESRSQAVRRFLCLERSLRAKGKFQEFAAVLEEYFRLGHAEPVPPVDLNRPCHEVFYLPMHAVSKNTSTTTQLRIVFDASARTSTGASLNDQLLVGPTMHAPLLDVLLRFRLYKVALTTDVSKMYRAVLLPDSQRDLHRFVWRIDPQHRLLDYRMTRLTFGVSASSFAANMSIRENAIQHQEGCCQLGWRLWCKTWPIRDCTTVTG